ncbi:CD109 antigen isoform X1 [Folsomia candida]|uniref:CD109 antigen isoform X1 n=1 Tax=Folsomia candida TaxID=158441 RepID=UPI000B8F2FAB|nr:CD109 antigen isoform X1 [Folsomia candida]XP_021955891.1 CD109 antigen isoform X1 [Folsomia candida]
MDLLRLKHLCLFLSIAPLVTAQSGTYTIIAPRTIRSNLPYNVGVSVEADSPVQVVVSIKSRHLSGGSSGSTQQTTVDPKAATSQLITLQVGDLVDGGSYNLTVRGTGGLNFENTTELIYSPKSSSIIIQTDKPIYKPGELVQFRVLYLDRSLRPKGPGTLDIVVKDSQGNIIKQWKNIVVQRGMFAEQLQLSSQPNLGDWTMEVTAQNQKETQQFAIAEYVLPKFNVDINMPSFGTFNSSKITTRVRATYTYGQPVKGELVISAYPTIHSSYIQPVFPGVVRKTVQINGDAEVEFDLATELQLTDDYQRSIQIETTVTEQLTGRQQNATKTIVLHKYEYKLEIVKGSESFKPGLPYTIIIKVATQDDVPISDPRTDALQVKHGFSYNHDEFQMSTYPIPPSGLVTLTFDAPKNESLVALGIEATYKDLTEWFPTVQKALSQSNAYIEAVIKSGNPTVNTEVEVDVTATVQFDTLYYELVGRGDLLISRKVSLRNPSDRLNFRVLAPINSAPKATLIIHIIHENEIIADAVEFNVGGSLDNFLNITMTANQVEPGKDVEIVVGSRPNSLIGLRGIDQSVLILRQDKDINLATAERELEAWNSIDRPNSNFRFKRSLFAPSGASTASAVYEKAGLVILTNAVVHQQPPVGLRTSDKANPRPIRPFYDASLATSSLRPDIGPPISYNGPTRGPLQGPYAFSRIPRPKLSPYRIFLSNLKQLPAPTWIFNSSLTGYDGRSKIKKTVPDTITSWVISGFSLDNVYGLGISDVPMKLKVFRPFFISLNIPYSVVKGEAVGVQVLVHNYMERNINADITLDNSGNQFSFTQDENEIESRVELYRTEKVSVPANSVSSVTFLITPVKLGLIDLSVKAESRIAGDALVKMLKVVPPGQPQKLNKAIMIDSRRPSSVPLNLTTKFPAKRVPDSDFVKFTVVGDILGPAITNLDRLLEMPTGCGEQNMIKFVPDVVILEYLQATRQLSEATRAKAIEFLEIGYQRQLSYRHEDGSFSAFGPISSNSGSTWLTAFVIQAFISARPYIFIDKAIIEKALTWLVSKQEISGKFKEQGRIYDTNLPGQSSEGLALTAYVTLALLEAESDSDIKTDSRFATGKNLALDFLTRNLEGLTDPYAVSIITFVLTKADHYSKQGAFNILEGLAKISDDGQFKHWETIKSAEEEKNPWSKNPRPIGIEASSYALLTYSQRNYVGDSIPVVRWLLAQRNANGGFISTQDTIVALTALARFARLSRTSSINLHVEITYEGGSQGFEIKDENAIMLQEFALPANTRWVNVESTGTGVAIAQLSWGYNIEVTGAWPSFTLDPQLDRTSNTNQMTLSVCTSFYGGNQSNMAVMEVNMPTGFQVNKDKLANLLHYPAIKRFETDEEDSKVVMYFDSLENRQENCPTVSAYRVFPVAKQAPAYVTVYDYYDNSRKARQFYNAPKTTLCDICDEKLCSQECLVARQRQSQENARVNKASSSAIPNLLRTSIFTLISYFSILFIHE